MRCSSDINVNARDKKSRRNLLKFTGTGERQKHKKKLQARLANLYAPRYTTKEAGDPPNSSVFRSAAPSLHSLFTGTPRSARSSQEALKAWKAQVEQIAESLNTTRNIPIERARDIAASQLLSSGITPQHKAYLDSLYTSNRPYNVGDILTGRENALREPGAAALVGLLNAGGLSRDKADAIGGTAGLANNALLALLGKTNKFPRLSKFLTLAEENPLIAKARTGRFFPSASTKARPGFGGKLLAAEMALKTLTDPRGSKGLFDMLIGSDPTTYNKLQDALASREAYSLLDTLGTGSDASSRDIGKYLGKSYDRSSKYDLARMLGTIPATPINYLDEIFTGGLGDILASSAGIPGPNNLIDTGQAAASRMAARSMGADLDPFEKEKRKIRSILNQRQEGSRDNFIRSIKRTLATTPPGTEDYEKLKDWLVSIESGDVQADPNSARFSAGFEQHTPYLGKGEDSSDLLDVAVNTGLQQHALFALPRILGTAASRRPQLERAQQIRQSNYEQTGTYMPMHEAYRLAASQQAPQVQQAPAADPTKSVWQVNLQQANQAENPVNMLKSQSNWYRNFYDRTTSGTGDYNYWRSLSKRFDSPEKYKKYVTPEVLQGIKSTDAYKDVMKGLGGQWSQHQVGTFLKDKKPYELKSIYGGTRKDIKDKYTKGRRLNRKPTKYYNE